MGHGREGTRHPASRMDMSSQGARPVGSVTVRDRTTYTTDDVPVGRRGL